MIWQLHEETVYPNRTMKADGDWLKVRPIDMSVDFGYEAPQVAWGPTGRRIDETHVPRNMQLGFGQREKIEPDFMNVHGYTMVSHLFREFVESIEPGVHQFIDVNAVSRAKKPYAKQYAWFNCCQRVFALDTEKSRPKMVPFAQGGAANPYDTLEALMFDKRGTFHEQKPVFRADRIGDRQIFADGDFYRRVLITQAVKDALEASGLVGFGFSGPFEISG